jgi:hypothetical protein
MILPPEKEEVSTGERKLTLSTRAQLAAATNLKEAEKILECKFFLYIPLEMINSKLIRVYSLFWRQAYRYSSNGEKRFSCGCGFGRVRS